VFLWKSLENMVDRRGRCSLFVSNSNYHVLIWRSEDFHRFFFSPTTMNGHTEPMTGWSVCFFLRRIFAS
jgi:hypothetical protein